MMNPATKRITTQLALFSLSGAAGYFTLSAWLPPESGTVRGRETENATARATAIPKAPLIGDPSKSTLVAEWEKLRAQHGRTPADFLALYEAAKKEEDPFRQSAFLAAVFAEWAGVDPAGGYAFLRANAAWHVAQFMHEWLRHAPDAAVDAILAETVTAKEKAKGKDLDGNAVGSFLDDIARFCPRRLAEACTAYQPGAFFSDPGTVPRHAFELYARQDLAAARAAAEAMSGHWRGDAIEGVARVWGPQDPAAAFAWAQQFEEDEQLRRNISRLVLLDWAKRDPFGALDRLDLVMSKGPAAAAPAPDSGDEPGDGRDVDAATVARKIRMNDFDASTVSRILQEAGLRDWDATLEWLRKNPERATQASLNGLGDGLARRLKTDVPGTMSALLASVPNDLAWAFSAALRQAPAVSRPELWQWLAAQPESPMVSEMRSALVEQFMAQDPAAAAGLLTGLVDSPETHDFLQGAAAWYFKRENWKGDSVSERMGEAWKTAPPSLYPALFEMGLQEIHEIKGESTDGWTARLKDLPEKSRARMAGEVAELWAKNEPAAAVQWAMNLPAPGDRVVAFERAVSSWVARQPKAVASFLEDYPESPERQAGIRQYVYTTVERDPGTAWAWALEIESDPDRQLALQHIYPKWRAEDADAAEAALEESGFSTSEIEKLRAGISGAR